MSFFKSYDPMTTPAVFVVGNEYQIMVRIKSPVLFSIIVGGKEYFDESNGIMRSKSQMHRVSVPMEELDKVGEYTLRIRPIVKRKPYFTKTKPVTEHYYSFNSIPEKGMRAYHIADAHNNFAGAVNAAKTFGDIDLLILNGDVIDHSGDPSKFDIIYKICQELTRGEKPVIFSRGNHDMRGNFAEKFAEYTPNFKGNTYYTFRLKNIWGILVDCGEDKADTNEEYGYTVACSQFRENETEFIKDVISRKDEEYEADGITRKLVISHVPFTRKEEPPFDSAEDTYREWATLLRENVRPDLMICGHTHRYAVIRQGDEADYLGQPCTIVVGSQANKHKGYIGGCGFIFSEDETEVVFTDCNGETVGKAVL